VDNTARRRDLYAHPDAAQVWKDIAGNLPGVHGMPLGGPGAARRRSHGKIVLRLDMAVVDDEHPGRYLLGIECDGVNRYLPCAICLLHPIRLRNANVVEDMRWIRNP
jgi:hypothetical protein